MFKAKKIRLFFFAAILSLPITLAISNTVFGQAGLVGLAIEHKKKEKQKRPAAAVTPRAVSKPKADFAKTAQNVAPGVVLVGHPKFGYGTAWVISKEHRLLATNAHVADIMHKAGSSMYAIQNGTSKRGTVQNVWYHPGLRRKVDNDATMILRSMDPKIGPVHIPGPDVAVIQLTDNSPELSHELTMASAEELKQLVGKQVSMTGFPGHDTKSWPPVGENATATLHQGAISRVTDFESYGTNSSKAQLLQYTMQSWGGFSGSPVFLPNGHVVGLHFMARLERKNRGITGNEVRSLPHGVRVDCLWELLVHHKLVDKVNLATEQKRVDIKRWLKDDPNEERTQKILDMLKTAKLLIQKGECDKAIKLCDDTLAIRPNFRKPLLQRAIARIKKANEQRSNLSHYDIVELYEEARREAKAYQLKNPSDPDGVICEAVALHKQGIVERPLSRYMAIDTIKSTKRRWFHENQLGEKSKESLKILLDAEFKHFRKKSSRKRLKLRQVRAMIQIAHNRFADSYLDLKECILIDRFDPINFELLARCIGNASFYDNIRYGRTSGNRWVNLKNCKAISDRQLTTAMELKEKRDNKKTPSETLDLIFPLPSPSDWYEMKSPI